MNRLADATSPYLRQHATNPVDWYPWGPAALQRAREEDKPILLSIGYSACHWCHVMAHESFENAAIAALMNEKFVNIKVDREERPDLDSIYMQAVQAMTGHGGWPMTVFLTPEGKPFFGGTYFPPNDRQGMPGFPRVLHAIAQAYATDRQRVESAALHMQDIYERGELAIMPTGSATSETLHRAARRLAGSYDQRYAGFGSAPKFPPTMCLEFLLAHAARNDDAASLRIAGETFRAMAAGGIYDQIGGGLHRYSVDEKWLVPHFEKMLYDNALFVRLGCHLWQATSDSEVRRVTEQTVAWLACEMTDKAGGFYSALDADSEGHEGKFYVWSLSELQEVLGDDSAAAVAAWGVSAQGNFEGQNILSRVLPLEAVVAQIGMSAIDVEAALGRARDALYARRAQRIWPERDDKVVASWNGLMLRALAECARAFGSERARTLADANADFLATHMVQGGRVLRSWRQGVAGAPGFLEDQAAVGLGLLEWYGVSGDPRWLECARELAECTLDEFFDRDAQLFFDTSRKHEQLITRPRDVTDNAMPSGTSLAAEFFARLAVYDDTREHLDLSRNAVDRMAHAMSEHPLAFGHLLMAADLVIYGATEVAFAGARASAERNTMESALGSIYAPSLVVDPALGAYTALSHFIPREGRAAAYVCKRYVCDAPSYSAEELRASLTRARTRS